MLCSYFDEPQILIRDEIVSSEAAAASEKQFHLLLNSFLIFALYFYIVIILHLWKCISKSCNIFGEKLNTGMFVCLFSKAITMA